jgi:hypothetical protein
MFTSPSFFALMRQPSVRSNIARAIAPGDESRYAASRSRISHAFSANRAASRKSGTPRRSQISRVARRLASETGCPPHPFDVAVMTTSGTRFPAARS